MVFPLGLFELVQKIQILWQGWYKKLATLEPNIGDKITEEVETCMGERGPTHIDLPYKALHYSAALHLYRNLEHLDTFQGLKLGNIFSRIYHLEMTFE